MTIELRRAEVSEGLTGHKLPAVVLRCCGQDRFHVFQLAGQQHPHLQCCSCGTSYCAGGCANMERLP